MSTNEELVLRAEQAAQQTAKDKADIQELVTKLEEVQAPSIAASKEDIRQAIIEKGVECGEDIAFSEYGNKIRGIETGGNTGDDSIDIPLLLMHFNDNLDIQGKLSTSVAFGYKYNSMYGETNTYIPSYEDGMFGRKCLYIEPPTQEEIDYGEAWNKYIELPITNYFIDNDYTLDFWFKLVEGFNISVCNNLINISNSIIRCNISDGISTESFQCNSTIDSTWHHIALVKFSGIYYLYLDGIKISTYDKWDTKHQNIVYMKIGSTDSIIAGYVDEFRITQKALWTENFTPPQVETTEYDKKEEHIVLVDAPFIDSLQVNPECSIAGNSLSIGERGGVPCVVDSTGSSYMRKDWFQPTRKYYTSLWFWSDKDTANYIMDFAACRLLLNSGGVVDIWGHEITSVNSSAGAFLQNAWNHVLWQYDATTRTVWLYVNGKFEASVANRNSSYNTSLVIFGGLQGGIRNLQIVSGLLTDDEIENIYNKGV